MRRSLAAVAGAAVVVGLAAGCSGPHPSLNINGGAINGCFRDLPVAVQALHATAKPQFRGVHRVPLDVLRKHLPQLLPKGENDTVVCAFAFHGQFGPGQVDKAPPDATGTYAVVLVDAKTLRVVQSYVGDRLPERFGRRIAV
jgi:hypothetical protein